MSELKVIGQRVMQKDGVIKATGAAQYVTDMKLPGMLYGKILRSPYPHARILSIDTSKARQLSGVKAVITFEDTPQIRFGPIIDDWYILAKDKVTFVGQEVAAVAAISEEAAQAAVDLIKVEYEQLPAVFTPQEALMEGAPVINPDYPDNVATVWQAQRGDVDKAMAQADLVIGDTFYTSQVYQAYMETFAGIAQYDSGGYTMWLPTQVASKSRLTYAKALGIRPRDIRVIKPHVGGAFGAKFEYDSHLVAAVLAKKTGRPVKIVNTRQEDIEAGNPRVPMYFDLKLALKKDGTILAKDLKLLASNGGRTVYGPPVMSTACYRIDTMYKILNLRAKGKLLYTNTVPTGCFRGFGNSQATFALECLLDMAAKELNIDPAELRMKNSYRDGETSPHGWYIPTTGLVDTIKQATAACSWQQQREDQAYIRRGIGMACSNHVSGNRSFFQPFDGSSALLRIGEGGQAVLIQAEAEIGQGQNTVFSMMAAEAAGLRYNDVKMADHDTLVTAFGLGSFATRGTTVGGHASVAAGLDAKQKLLAEASLMYGVSANDINAQEGVVFQKSSRKQLGTVAEVASQYMHTHGGAFLTGEGYYVPKTVLPDPVTKIGNISPVYCFGTHIAEVEVDIETGLVQVTNFWASHDVGRVLNPIGLEGQVEGGVVMGIGWALMEDMITVDGKVQNNNLLDYRIPGVLDIPKIHVSFVETNDPQGPYGAKGIGEPALNPAAAAVANAIYDAIGIRFNELPITPEKILAALQEQ